MQMSFTQRVFTKNFYQYFSKDKRYYEKSELIQLLRCYHKPRSNGTC